MRYHPNMWPYPDPSILPVLLSAYQNIPFFGQLFASGVDKSERPRQNNSCNNVATQKKEKKEKKETRIIPCQADQKRNSFSSIPKVKPMRLYRRPYQRHLLSFLWPRHFILFNTERARPPLRYLVHFLPRAVGRRV